MGEHVSGVRREFGRAGFRDTVYYRGVCSCGWVASRRRIDEAGAKADADRHATTKEATDAH